MLQELILFLWARAGGGGRRWAEAGEDSAVPYILYQLSGSLLVVGLPLSSSLHDPPSAVADRQAGAKHVYGIECSAIANQAKQIVSDNG